MLELVIFLVFAVMFLGPCMVATRAGVEEEREDEDERFLQPS